MFTNSSNVLPLNTLDLYNNVYAFEKELVKQYLIDSEITKSHYFKTLPSRWKDKYLILGHERFKDALRDTNCNWADYN